MMVLAIAVNLLPVFLTTIAVDLGRGDFCGGWKRVNRGKSAGVTLDGRLSDAAGCCLCRWSRSWDPGYDFEPHCVVSDARAIANQSFECASLLLLHRSDHDNPGGIARAAV